MRIAIIGAPSSGKSDLARSMARALNRERGAALDRDKSWKVIDGYVDNLTRRTGTQYGHTAGYVENVSIMSYRWILEDEAAHQGYNTITCGSIYDTFTYAALLNVVPAADEQAALFQRNLVTVMMNFFALMEPAGRYDRLFYLPWENREHEHSWDAVVNAKIPEVLMTCGVACTELKGSKREKLRDALKITRFIRDQVYEEQATVADQPGV